MKVLVAGITGFIGSHVAELVLRSGDEVIGLSHGDWHDDAPQELRDSVELLQWDITQPAPAEIVAKTTGYAPDVMFHFAGISIPALCGKDDPSDEAIAVNVMGTRHVLNLFESWKHPARFVFASTCHVYAPVDGYDPFVDELAPIDPISAYGKTKLQSETEILRRVRDSGLNACIVRGFHHIGPRQPSGLMLTDWLGQLEDPGLRELKVRSTNSHLDLVDVRDAAVAYRLVAMQGVAGKVYNLGSGKISRSGDILQVILSNLHREIEVVTAAADERWNAIARIGRLSSLGWNPQTRCEQTVRDMMGLVGET